MGSERMERLTGRDDGFMIISAFCEEKLPERVYFFYERTTCSLGFRASIKPEP